MTQEEFRRNLQNIVKALRALGVRKRDMFFSWDNAHNNGAAADLVTHGIPAGNKLPLPPYSPDIHRVVEHCIHQMKAALDADMLGIAGTGLPENPEQTMQLLVRRAFKQLTPAAIDKDVSGLPLAYKLVAGAKGSTVKAGGRTWECTGGDWLPHKLR